MSKIFLGLYTTYVTSLALIASLLVLTNVCMYSTWPYSTLNTTVAAAYGRLRLCSAYMLAKMHINICRLTYCSLIHVYICCCVWVTDTCIQSIGRPTVYMHSCHIYTLLYTYAILAHTLVLIGSQTLVPAGLATTLLSKMLTANGTHTGSLSCILIWYCHYFLYTIGMCHMFHAYLCYVWLL